MVILLKIVVIKKEFDEEYVFELVENMLNYTEDYIQKGIGWLLKTCSKFNPDSIFGYLMNNKERLPRLILRYSSEKLSNEKRKQILKK
ncbi:MAG: DNA alkylation repair protein [Candidatus Lokiarchaeota archaeon]|nr:DNA alkylation repair protein [Candidatus Lokiarchaeota archaeon]